jgi:DeoR/GlpR family transcriptional regulator of sugar metabolism
MTERTVEESKPLLAAERRARITDLAIQRGSVRVNELSDLFQVSEVTIRGDLDLLARRGVLLRDHGGAIVNTRTGLVTAFEQRASLNLEEKRRIGRVAAGMVEPGETIIMDAGTTTMEMARSLPDVAPLTVVTNALNVATQVGALPGVHVILVGGSLSRETISTVGPYAERDLNDLIVHKVFLGAHAVDLEAGVADMSLEIAKVKRAMIGAAQQVILLADSSKWGRTAFAKVVPLTAVHVMVTDSNLPEDARTVIERLGVRLVLT